MSFLKKGAGKFKPKVQPRPLRKKAAETAVAAVTLAPSPPSTQVVDPIAQADHEETQNPETQTDDTLTKVFSDNEGESAIVDDMVDPKDPVNWSPTILENVNEDLNQPPTPVSSQHTNNNNNSNIPKRRTSSSSVQHLRLSGITPPIFRARSSSISQTVAFSRSTDSNKKPEEREERTPMPIDIPASGKRRRSLVKHSSYKRHSVARRGSVAIAESEPQTEKSSADTTRNSLRQATPVPIPKPIEALPDSVGKDSEIVIENTKSISEKSKKTETSDDKESTPVTIPKPTSIPISVPTQVSAPISIPTPSSVPTIIPVPTGELQDEHDQVSESVVVQGSNSVTISSAPLTASGSYKETSLEIRSRFPPNTKFIMALNGEKLQKYRFCFGTEEDIKKYTAEELLIPVCPETVKTEITKVDQLPRGVKFEDTDIYSHVSIDISNFKMADLCKPLLPIGEVSENFGMAHMAKQKQKEAREKRRQDRILAKANMISLEDTFDRDLDNKRIKKTKAELEEEEEREEESNHGSTAIQLQLTSDGKLDIDEDSTVVNRHQMTSLKNKTREEANPFENPVISLTYSKRSHTDKWTSEEEKQFYKAILTWGTDFTFIAQLFPYRTRKQIKAKFNLEERHNPEIIEMALRRRLPANFDEYSRGIKVSSDVPKKKERTKEETRDEFIEEKEKNDHDNNESKPLGGDEEKQNGEEIIKTPLDIFNEEVRRLRQQHKEHMALIAKEREKAMKEDAEASRLREIEYRSGGTKFITRLRGADALRKNEEVMGSIDDVKLQLRHNINDDDDEDRE